MPKDPSVARAHPALRALSSLARAEVTLIAAYERMIRGQPGELEGIARRAKADCERHVLGLGRILGALGAKPPRLNAEGRVWSVSPASRWPRGAPMAATRLARRYEAALAWDLPLEVIAALHANAIDLRAQAVWLARLQREMNESAAHRWLGRAKVALHQLGRRVATSTMRA